MVLNDLGKDINKAFSNLFNTNNNAINEKVLDDLLKDICKSLLQSDVNVKLVQQLRANIKKRVNLAEQPVAINKQRLIQNAVVDELCHLMDPGVAPFKPVKGKANVIMMVGLQGAGKTTSCSKLAAYWHRRSWKVALICADTFRAGAFDQLKQNAVKCGVPFYGSYTEEDPSTIVREGLEKFKRENFEIILVDTSGRHMQEEALFAEMKGISDIAQPDNIIFVMDAAMGQAAQAQAEAFKATVNVGSIIITKMDGHARGGGALSAVAATGSPIMMIGVGEHMNDIEPFAVKPFVSKMMGMGDVQGLMDRVRAVQSEEKSMEMMEKLKAGIFTLNDLYEQLGQLLQMGPLSKVLAMIPGMNAEAILGASGGNGDEEIEVQLKRCMTIMDSMTKKELAGNGQEFVKEPSRTKRLAMGAGVHPKHINELLQQYKKFAQIVKKMGGNKGLFNMMGSAMGSGASGRGGNSTNASAMNRQIESMMPPGMLQQMGGMGNIQSMMKQMQESMGMGAMGSSSLPTNKKKPPRRK